MERRHFELIARRIRHRVETCDTPAMQSVYDQKTRDAIRMELRLVACDFADCLGAENPRFDATRFMKAAGF